FPAEFHAQTAVECAIRLHPQIIDRVADIKSIRIETQESAVRIISKTGTLYNPADRDHCIQYMTAIGLLFGNLTAAHYENDIAADNRIDALRDKMQVVEEPRYSKEYLDADKRSIANAIQVFFNDGSSSERIEVEYPLGHRRRREESRPHLQAKFDGALQQVFDGERCAKINALFADEAQLRKMPVHELTNLFARD
ncbi:MAG: 2-methylcitrate dehydratase, partial [Proteobacteria bacterium]|nr:2-methylcitrate dehydratase [Pseudomonadota bacterium]